MTPLFGGRQIFFKFSSYVPKKRKMRSVELNDLYSSRNIIRVIKSIKMGWAGYVARMVEKRGVYRVLVRKPEGKRPLEDPGVDGE